MSLLSGLSILLHLSKIEPLLVNIDPVIKDFEKIFASADFGNAIVGNPALQADVAKISQLWRTEENDVTAIMRDKNIKSKWNAIDMASKDGNTLAQSLGRVLESPEVHDYLGSNTGAVRDTLFDLQNRLGQITASLEALGVKLPDVALPSLS